jgi:hypothetical protein
LGECVAAFDFFDAHFVGRGVAGSSSGRQRRKDSRMQFMMFVCSDSEPDDKPETPGEIGIWVDALEKSGQRLMGDRLRPKADARTVRVRKGKVIVTDGPFTESKEVIVGFDILDCDSMEEAVSIAAKHPMARAGRLELRPFWPFEG